MPFVVCEELPPDKCQLCDEVKELRPYGPGGIWVCFPCGMKDEKTTKAAFDRRFDLDGQKAL